MHQKRHVFEFMTRAVYTALPETSLREITTRLVELRATAAPVVNHEGMLVGLVGLADIAVDLPLRPAGSEPGERLARDIMQHRVFTVEQGHDLSSAIEQMRQHRVHRLVVTEGDRVVGVLSCLDILNALPDVLGYSPWG